MLTLAGCGLVGSEEPVDGHYAFANAFGYVETVVVQNGGFEELRFEVTGTLTLQEGDGSVTGNGSCTRTTISTVQPEDIETRTEVTDTATFSGLRSGSSLTGVRLAGCAFPRPMFGSIEKGRLVLNTDLDFPVSRGTTVISDRFGDPKRLVLTRSGS
ncbi:MAG: hypothetical protein HKN29_16515 [Rhodothermales bacterium]|nr:hypothetical protein [Rhodothermales bacterium]